MTGRPHQPNSLYHYTCSHGAKGIRRDGIIKPTAMLSPAAAQVYRENFGAPSLVWLTDLAPPVARHWLGLTMHNISCDRLSYVFVVEDLDGVIWFMRYRKLYPGLRALEHEPGAQPAHWFVAETPVPTIGEATIA